MGLICSIIHLNIIPKNKQIFHTKYLRSKTNIVELLKFLSYIYLHSYFSYFGKLYRFHTNIIRKSNPLIKIKNVRNYFMDIVIDGEECKDYKS